VRDDRNGIAEVIEAAFLDWERGPTWEHDVAFHLTDWLENLEEWEAFCAAPEEYEDDQELRDMLLLFVAHVPAHLAAAHKMVIGFPVTDVFGIGAVSENDEE